MFPRICGYGSQTQTRMLVVVWIVKQEDNKAVEPQLACVASTAIEYHPWAGFIVWIIIKMAEGSERFGLVEHNVTLEWSCNSTSLLTIKISNILYFCLTVWPALLEVILN